MDIFQFIAEIANNQLKPTIVDTNEGTYEGDSVMLKFIGYALPSCTGVDDPKWLIQLHVKYNFELDGDDSMTSQQIDIIGFANGVRKFDQAWSNRAALSYRPTPKSESFYDNGTILFNNGWFDMSDNQNNSGGGGGGK